MINGQGLLLVCRRADQYKTWQLPQGGVNEGESLEECLLRELEEEIGTCSVEILGQLPESICYDWPAHAHRDGWIGQEQYYFLVRLRPGEDLNLHRSKDREFEEYQWVNAAEFMRRTEDFKKNAYTQALDSVIKLFPGLIA